MIGYRIANCDYANDLNGTGARLYGGRWNSEGMSMLYLASSRSLAVLEVLVHLPPLLIPSNYCAIEVELPESSIITLPADELPDGWQDIATTGITRKRGDSFLKSKEYLVMKVPSIIVPSEYNYLVNPMHADMQQVKITRKGLFNFDERLFFRG